MFKRFLSTVVLACSLCLAASAQSRQITNFDADWKFKLGDTPGAQNTGFNDRAWRQLNVPHDWSIEGEINENNPGGGSVGYYPTGTGWYRKTFNVPDYKKDKNYSIEFDGVYMNSTVWINGHQLGTWPYGYSSFSYDLTPYLKATGNVIAVKVDNSLQPNSRWYSGSGIYRHVRLVSTSKTYFDKWGVFNYTKEIQGGKAVIQVTSSVTNKLKSRMNGTVKHVVLDADGRQVAESSVVVEILAGTKHPVVQTITIENPILWDLDNPYLYTLRSYILDGDKELDCVDNVLGVRTIEYPIDKGFLLNGKQVKMYGVNVHHDGGPVGAAVPARVWERRLEILKSSGCNAIRTAHNAPDPTFLDLCDRLGFLVMDEAFDQWVAPKNTYDYNLYFYDWHERDLAAMVMRDRNHPSVVMWSIGNEIKDQYTEVGPAIARELIAQCHKLDPTRLVTAGNDEIASNTPATPEYLAAFENDIVGYNYPDRWRDRRELMFDIDKAAFPNRRVVTTEAGGNGGSRGSYMWNGNGRFGGGFGSVDTEERWKYTLIHDFVIGDFMWTGIDYYGESRWPSKGFGSGYIDNCGFKKDGYYFFKSIWTDEPVLHILPNWNWAGHEGEIMRLGCYTNCESVELFVNGKSYGKKGIEFPRLGLTKGWGLGNGRDYRGTTSELHLEWDVEYQPGEVKMVGIKNGKEITDIIRTFGEPAKIRLSVDRPEFTTDPDDVAHVTVEILDKDGNLCQNADNRIKLTVSGAEVLGMENGNMRDLSSTKTSERDTWCGMALAILSADKAGTVTVKAESAGLPAAEISFRAK
ncbi:MAG: DUF4982 domain-containing protein [Bacteroidales bacterium]|nr:DUF4982 domain-containing protein [Bacteroidales bacterium]